MTSQLPLNVTTDSLISREESLQGKYILSHIIYI